MVLQSTLAKPDDKKIRYRKLMEKYQKAQVLRTLGIHLLVKPRV